METENVAEIIEAPISDTATVAVAEVERTEAVTDAAVDIAAIETQGRVAETEIQADAAVAIAAIAASTDAEEDDNEWLEFLARFGAVEGVLAIQSAQLQQMGEAISAMAAVMIQPSTQTIIAEPTQTPAADLPTSSAESPNDADAAAPPAVERKRKFNLI